MPLYVVSTCIYERFVTKYYVKLYIIKILRYLIIVFYTVNIFPIDNFKLVFNRLFSPCKSNLRDGLLLNFHYRHDAIYRGSFFFIKSLLIRDVFFQKGANVQNFARLAGEHYCTCLLRNSAEIIVKMCKKKKTKNDQLYQRRRM